MADCPDRSELIYRRINERIVSICEAVPPIQPGLTYWLESDATESYCRKHAIEAREKEFGLGPLLEDKPFYRRTELEDAFFLGIGASDGGESDHPEACARCGETLSYCLTDYGMRSEIDYFLEAPLAELNGEVSYGLDRLTACIWPGANRADLLGVDVAVNQAWRLLPTRTHGNIDTVSNQGSRAAT